MAAMDGNPFARPHPRAHPDRESEGDGSGGMHRQGAVGKGSVEIDRRRGNRHLRNDEAGNYRGKKIRPEHGHTSYYRLVGRLRSWRYLRSVMASD